MKSDIFESGKNVVSYGAGTNSTAIVVGMINRGMKIDAIVFADTGGEKTATYEYVKMFSSWVESKGLAPIITVRNDGAYITLENECIQKKTLPSIAFGFKSCSDKYKIRPFNKFIKSTGWVDVNVFIGYDTGESGRVDNAIKKKSKHNRIFPLMDWVWSRDDCRDAIKKEGLPQPGKSACFFCPNNKKHEILKMARETPDLIDRAVFMERNATNARLAGLGRAWSWKDLVCADDEQLKLFGDVCMGDPCGCYDGGE